MTVLAIMMAPSMDVVESVVSVTGRRVSIPNEDDVSCDKPSVMEFVRGDAINWWQRHNGFLSEHLINVQCCFSMASDNY